MQPQDPLQDYCPQIHFPVGSMGTLELSENGGVLEQHALKMPFQVLPLFREHPEQIGEERKGQQVPLGRGQMEEAKEEHTKEHQFASGYHVPADIKVYPPPMAEHDELLANRQLFDEALNAFQGSLGRRLTVPNIGGQELDLHMLYREVTACGGLEQVIKDRRWKEVATAVNFPGSVTNPSFVLRKHYINLLYHFEQIYYFKAHGQLPFPPGPLPAPSPVVKSTDNEITYQLPVDPAHSVKRRKRRLDPAQLFGVDPGASVGHTVTGAIDGKFDSGYLVTVVVGSEKLNGILYHVPTENAGPQFASVPGLISSVGSELDALGLEVQVTKRKRETAPKKDPNAPRPARTGYNYFYAEQRARLKKIHSQTDREIGRMVVDLWNRLSDNEKLPYIEQSQQDKERFKREMMYYNERLKMQAPSEGYIVCSAAEAVGQENEGHGIASYYHDGSHDYHVSLDAEADMNSFHIHQQQGVQTEVIGTASAAHHVYSSQADGHIYPVHVPEPQVPELDVGSSGCLSQTYKVTGDGYAYQTLTLQSNICQSGLQSCPVTFEQGHWVQEGENSFCVQEDAQA
eukprot:Gb_39139 [translate_table: standard]